MALHQALIPNWTSPAFDKFVDATRALVDELANTTTARDGKEEMQRCDEVFRQICWLEQRFWPEVDGMGEEGDRSQLDGPSSMGPIGPALSHRINNSAVNNTQLSNQSMNSGPMNAVRMNSNAMNNNMGHSMSGPTAPQMHRPVMTAPMMGRQSMSAQGISSSAIGGDDDNTPGNGDDDDDDGRNNSIFSDSGLEGQVS